MQIPYRMLELYLLMIYDRAPVKQHPLAWLVALSFLTLAATASAATPIAWGLMGVVAGFSLSGSV